MNTSQFTNFINIQGEVMKHDEYNTQLKLARPSYDYSSNRESQNVPK